MRFRKSVYATLSFLVLLWTIKILEYSLGYDFGSLGIFPRTLEGSIGILTGPLIHGDIYHLLSNTFPIIFLGIGITYFYDRIAAIVFGLIYIMTGFWVWIAARDAYHIGASGVVYGMLTFLLFSGFFRRDTQTLSISFIVLFIYGGGFATGLIPSDEGISWESHLMGAIAGIFCAVYFKNTRLSGAQEIEETNQKDSVTYNYIYVEQKAKESHNSKVYTIDISLGKDNSSNSSGK